MAQSFPKWWRKATTHRMARSSHRQQGNTESLVEPETGRNPCKTCQSCQGSCECGWIKLRSLMAHLTALTISRVMSASETPNSDAASTAWVNSSQDPRSWEVCHSAKA